MGQVTFYKIFDCNLERKKQKNILVDFGPDKLHVHP
jgi:hypothetical protein